MKTCKMYANFNEIEILIFEVADYCLNSSLNSTQKTNIHETNAKNIYLYVDAFNLKLL